MSKPLDSKVAFAGINVRNSLIEQLEFFRTQLIINPTDTVVTEQMQIVFPFPANISQHLPDNGSGRNKNQFQKCMNCWKPVLIQQKNHYQRERRTN